MEPLPGPEGDSIDVSVHGALLRSDTKRSGSHHSSRSCRCSSRINSPTSESYCFEIFRPTHRLQFSEGL